MQEDSLEGILCSNSHLSSAKTVFFFFFLVIVYCLCSLPGVLSVRENLQYSALLRLPGDMSRKEKMGRVEEVQEMQREKSLFQLFHFSYFSFSLVSVFFFVRFCFFLPLSACIASRAFTV
jgi:hypothetical protein